MSIKGAIRPLRMSRSDAEVAAALIKERTAGIDFRRTPLAALPTFGRKLLAALKRGNRSTTEIRMWNVARGEADAGYRFLMAFSHEDAQDCLDDSKMDAVHAVALDIAEVLFVRRGDPGLPRAAIEDRIRAWDDPENASIEPPNERWQRRLKQRLARDEAFWRTGRRRPLSAELLALLKPKRNTEN
jgi:hypothetical protein